MTLQNKSVAILIAPQGTEDAEFSQPKAALEKAGCKVTVIGLKNGHARTVNNDLEPGKEYAVDGTVTDMTPSEFDALVIPGGCVGADTLRNSKEAVTFVKGFFRQSKPVAATCHAPWLLVEANVLKGRTVTSFKSLETDIKNAGGSWVDREVVVDHGLITSRTPKDLPAFCSKMLEEFAEGKHREQAMSV